MKRTKGELTSIEHCVWLDDLANYNAHKHNSGRSVVFPVKYSAPLKYLVSLLDSVCTSVERMAK